MSGNEDAVEEKAWAGDGGGEPGTGHDFARQREQAKRGQKTRNGREAKVKEEMEKRRNTLLVQYRGG